MKYWIDKFSTYLKYTRRIKGLYFKCTQAERKSSTEQFTECTPKVRVPIS